MAWTAVTTPVAGTAISSTAFGIPVATNFALIGGAWTAYTPTTANITLGNGSLTGSRFKQIDKTIYFIVKFTFGSTSAVSGNPTFTLPVTAFDTGLSHNGTVFDASASGFFHAFGVQTSTTVLTGRILPASLGGGYSAMSSTAPMTWAAGDILTISGQYEAA